MMTRSARGLRLRACQRCGCDAYLAEPPPVAEWRYLQCARSVPEAMPALAGSALQQK